MCMMGDKGLGQDVDGGTGGDAGKGRGTVGLFTMISGNEGVNSSVIREDGSLLSATQRG